MIPTELLRWTGICLGSGAIVIIIYTALLFWKMHSRNPQLTRAKLFLRFVRLHRIHKRGLSLMVGMLAMGIGYSWMFPIENPLMENYLIALLVINLAIIYYAVFILKFVLR